MTNLTCEQLDRCFRDNHFPEIENDSRGIRFLKIRSLSRNNLMELLLNEHHINIDGIKKKEYLSIIFHSVISNDNIDNFINRHYIIERHERQQGEENLIDQLCRLPVFDWGGAYQNALEKHIVDNYVKRIKNFDEINRSIEGSLLDSVRGYTLNSWYNHWTSIIIEDIFKDHQSVLPAVGLVKKIDFFINNIPFDLKVTYFPEEFMKEKLKNVFGNELTRLKRQCRELNIIIPDDLNDKSLKIHLFNKLSEDPRNQARDFIQELASIKRIIIQDVKNNPNELKVWLYENQGEMRFDASNRFFLILIDENEYNASWKLKRNIVFLRDRISEHLDQMHISLELLNTRFFWRKENKEYECKSDILFLSHRR